jgi:hypothetical protein
MSALERWLDYGAQYRILELSGERAVLELLTCHGEPVDRLESRDERLLRYLRGREADAGV